MVQSNPIIHNLVKNHRALRIGTNIFHGKCQSFFNKYITRDPFDKKNAKIMESIEELYNLINRF